MKKNALFVFLILAAGQTHARLGETLEQIEKRVGNLQFSDGKDYLYATANDVAGFTRITFTFYKKELWSQKTSKCIKVSYFADYSKTPTKDRYTVIDAEKMIKRNYPNVEMKEVGSVKDSLKAIGISESYSNSWWARGEDGGFARLRIREDIKGPSFWLECRSHEIQKNDVANHDDEELMKEKKYDKL
jgi:hypothetical protein